MVFNKKLFFKIVTIILFFMMPLAYALPNPAAVNCIRNHHQFFLIQETGICVFADNSYCEEWSYFRHECDVGQYIWPEKKVDIKHLKKYCVSNENKVVLVKLCQ